MSVRDIAGRKRVDTEESGGYRLLMNDLPTRLFSARSERGLTQAQAAEQSDVGLTSWVAYEAGQRKPHAVNLGKLKRWLEGAK